MAVERTEDVMQPARKFHPEQYPDVTTPVLAGVVVEWARLRDVTQRRGSAELSEHAEVLMHLADACIAWGRRRGLADDRILVALEDARRFVNENPLSPKESIRATETVLNMAQTRERTRALLNRLTGGA